MTEQVKIFTDLGVQGSLIFLENNEEFPANPALGTMAIKDFGLYAYVRIGELETWYPFNNNKTKSYVHSQGVASSTWTIAHNLGSSDVWYQVYTTSGAPVFASRTILNNNTFTLDLVEAMTGVAIVVSPDTLDVPYVKSQSFTVGEGTENVTVIDNSGIRVNGEYVLTSGTVQPASADLTAIDALSGNSGFLKKTGANTWSLDTNTYITGNQSVSLSGDATGSGTTAITVTLANTGVTAGTYNRVTVDAKGRVTSANNVTFATVATSGSYADLSNKPSLATVATSGSYADLSNKPSLATVATSGSYNDLLDLPDSFSAAFSDLTDVPTTIAGYGITDAISSSLLAVSDGVATLDSNGKVPSDQLPSYVDDVLEYTNLAAFPVTGETGKIYVDKATNLTYRWSGTTYVQVGGSSTAEAALKLSTARNISATGDASWTVSFDGSANATAALTLANSGVTSGTYNNVTVNAKGLVTSASNASYLTGNQSITVSGDASGSGSTAITLTLANSGVTAGTYKSVTVDAKGRVTAGTNPTTLAGYGITDGMSSTSPTLTGTITQDGAIVSTLRAMAALTVDCSVGNYFTKTISSDSTFIFSNAPNSVAYSFTLRVTQSSGTYTTGITWPNSVTWPGNNAPSLTAGKTHMFVFVTENGGTTWRGAALTNYN